MEVINRLENPLLNRVEIRFEWAHIGERTPSREKMRTAIAALEPGASADTVVVKEVSTRFGQPLTSGLAFIYDSVESMQNEPKHILLRHSHAKEEPAPDAAEQPAEEASDDGAEDDVSGGEE